MNEQVHKMIWKELIYTYSGYDLGFCHIALYGGYRKRKV
jgi:hypothetical protein